MAETQTYTYRSLEISYRKVGNGKPLLLLHGWGSSGEVLLPLAKTLSDIRCSYVIDFPGFGGSAAPGTAWSVDDFADLIQSFIEDHNLSKTDLLAHSFGGRVTLKLCAREAVRDRIDKVLITGGAGMKPRRSPGFYLKRTLAKLLKAPFLILPPGAKEKALNRLRESSLWKSLGSSDYRKLTGTMRETFVRSVSEYLEKCLPDIPHEVLLLWGSEDESVPLYQAERMEKGIERAVLVVIDRAGHYAYLDRPDHFASIARAFFEG